MEPPATFASERVRDERVKVLRAVRALPLDDLSSHLVLGQYGEGEADGKKVCGYLDEAGWTAFKDTDIRRDEALY